MTSIGAAWALVSFGVAGIAGGRLALAWNGTPWTEANAGPVPARWIAPASSPSPSSRRHSRPPCSWSRTPPFSRSRLVSPGGQRAGFEATGTRLISFAATLLLVLFVLTPAALVASLAMWLTWGLLGPWSLVPAAAIGSVPVWVGVAAGVALLGRLFARFDVSAESWS